MKYRITALLLALTLLLASLSGCTLHQAYDLTHGILEIIAGEDEPGAAGESPAAAQQPAGLGGIPEILNRNGFEDPYEREFSELYGSALKYEPYEELDELRAAAERMVELSGTEGALHELEQLYEYMYEECIRILDGATIAMLLSDTDNSIPGRDEDAKSSDAIQTEALILCTDAVECVLDSQYQEEFADFIGEDVASMFDERKSEEVTRRITELMLQETQLTAEYEKFYMKEYTVEHEGEELTLNDIVQDDSLTYEEYTDLVNRLFAKMNDDCVGIYVQLTNIRREIALLEGYDDPVEYYYQTDYERDYSPEKAAEFHSSVKRHIVPVYKWMNEYSQGTDAVVETHEVLPLIGEHISDISPELAEVFRYMMEHDMCILADDYANSLDSGYTAQLYGDAQPVIYNFVYGNYRSITDTVHEFGHYCDLMLSRSYSIWSPSGSYDVIEIPSMGLEMLFYEYYDEMFDGFWENGDDEKADLLSSMIYGIVAGCAYDEAQQRVFRYEGELTTKVVNSIFREVLTEYLGESELDHGMMWVQVPHTFESPFYYLSYAAASTAALEIWYTGETRGHDAAKELYLKLLDMCGTGCGYFELMEKCEMQGFASEEYLIELGETVAKEVEELLWVDESFKDSPYAREKYGERMAVAA